MKKIGIALGVVIMLGVLLGCQLQGQSQAPAPVVFTTESSAVAFFKRDQTAEFWETGELLTELIRWKEDWVVKNPDKRIRAIALVSGSVSRAYRAGPIGILIDFELIK
jgi:hypothetical protein